MKAQLRVIKDSTGKVVVAQIWALVPSSDVNAMKAARVGLSNYIDSYVGDREHNVYLHSDEKAVSAIIVFEFGEYPAEDIELNNLTDSQ